METVSTATKTFQTDICRASTMGENNVLRISVLGVGIAEAVEVFNDPTETATILYTDEDENEKSFHGYVRLISVSLFADNSGTLVTLSKEEIENA